jgi:hypothetical protein
MEIKDAIVIVAALLSATVTIIVPVVNHYLSRKKYAHEKLWDLRREAYSKIISSLSDAVTQFAFSHAIGRTDTPNDPYRLGTSALRRARSVYEEAYILCSDGFLRLFKEIEVNADRLVARSASNGGQLSEILETGRGHLLAQARRELAS